MEAHEKYTADPSVYISHHSNQDSQGNLLRWRGYKPDQFLVLQDVLGTGSMAKVSLVMDVKSRLVGALKIYKPSKAKFAHQELLVFQLAGASQFLSHCIEAFIYKNTPIFLTEYAPFGNLDQLTSKKNGLGSEIARIYLLEIATAVDFLHQRSIIHRDIKPSNVLIMISGHVALSDFSLAYELTANGEHPFQICGSHVTRPPEVWAGKPYDFPVDMWQMGVSFYNIISNRWPFFHAFAKTQVEAVKAGVPIPFPPEKFTFDVADLISQMLQVQPSQRIQACNATMHSYFSSLVEPYVPPIPPSELMQLINFSDVESQIVAQLIKEVRLRHTSEGESSSRSSM